MDDSRPYSPKLLSLDGGGIRGLSSLMIFRYLMKQLPGSPKPCDYFDLIGGTSTGGSLGDGRGYLHRRVYELSEDKRHRASLPGQFADAFSLVGAYDVEALISVVKKFVRQSEGDEEAPMLSPEKRCKVFVCTHASGLNNPVLIRTYDHQDAVTNPSIENCNVWQAAHATAAAAGFFNAAKIGRQFFMDGATDMNNLVKELYREAKSLWPATRRYCLVSV